MKKVASYTMVGLAIISLSSCFLFRKHTDCPAYGANERINKIEVEKNIDAKTFIQEETKA